jgi:hypothetical protein
MNLRKLSTSAALFLFFVMPASTTYEMHDYGFGAGGVGVGDSSNYSISGIAGEVSGANETGSTYDLGPGLQFTRQSNTPAAPTFSNPGSSYNKLQFILSSGSNPSDTLYAIAISNDNFATTNYIQADNTVGATAVYQTYTAWGGGSGAYVIGLAANTTYKIKVRAVQTKYTESAFSAEASATTTTPSVTYDLDVSTTDSETSAPYTVAFGQLALGSVTTPTTKVWVDLATNAEQGAFVYVYSNSAGLLSSSTGHTITSATGDLASASEGFGLQVSTATQTSGGPLVAVSPYNGAGENVGVLDTTTRTIFQSSSASIVGGRGSVLLKAKASASTPGASDYSTVITMIASATF